MWGSGKGGAQRDSGRLGLNSLREYLNPVSPMRTYCRAQGTLLSAHGKGIQKGRDMRTPTADSLCPTVEANPTL